MSNNYYPTPSYGMGMSSELPLWNPQSPQINRYNNLMQQQQYNNMSQQSLQPQTNMNWVQVSNMQSAKEQIVQPNSTMWMMDASLPQIYVKSVDAVGTIKFKGYQLVDIEEKPQEQMINMNVNNNFVPVDRFNKLEEEFNNLQARVGMYESLFQGQSNKEEVAPKATTRRGGASNESTK